MTTLPNSKWASLPSWKEYQNNYGNPRPIRNSLDFFKDAKRKFAEIDLQTGATFLGLGQWNFRGTLNV
jgi:hypothetical protein